MTTITAEDFANSTTYDLGYSWTNTSYAVSSNTDYGNVNFTGGTIGEDAQVLRGYNWNGRSALPSDAIIQNILFAVRGLANGSADVDIFLKIGNNGTWKDVGSWTSSSYLERTGNGNLTYWGVTNDEAKAALESTSGGDGLDMLLTSINTGTGLIYCQYFEITVDYVTPSETSGILLAK